MAQRVDKVRTIRLYGILGTTFGRVHRYVINTPGDAFRTLCVMVPGFEHFLTHSREKGLTFSVFVGKDDINKDQLHHPSGGEDVRIAPIIIGSKKQGLFQTILGIVIMVAGVITGQPGVFFAGLSMTLGGVAMLMSPQSKGLAANDKPANRPSYAFNGPVNTQAQGNPIPVLYGELIVGSAVISAGIYAEDQL